MEMWPGGKTQGHIGPGEGYVLQRQTQLWSLSDTNILWCESLKAWLLFHFNSLAHIPLQPTSWFFPISSSIRTRHIAPVFTPVLSLHPSQKRGKTRQDQSGIRPSSLKVRLCASVCPCAHLCMCMLMLPGIWTPSSTIRQN